MPTDQPEHKQKELLFLCQTLPFPPDGGVNIRSYHLLRLLAQEYRVTAICFYRKAARPDAEAIERSLAGLEPFGAVEAYPLPQEHSRVRWVWDHLRSVATRRPYTVYTYASKKVDRRIATLLDERSFDLVHIESLDLAHYLPQVQHLPTVCDHHNVESALLERRAHVQTSWIKRRYMLLQAGLTHAEEARNISNFALNITCSNLDAQALRELAPGSKVQPVPNGVDTRSFTPDLTKPGRGIVFVGGYTWFPNRDGMNWFAKEILPRIRAQIPDVSTTWVGRMPESVGDSFRADGIDITGYVNDIRPYVQRAGCFIVPLRVGGGTRLKVLDAWAMGKAVVSTSIGCEGLEAWDGDNTLVRDEPQAFADAVIEVLRDDHLQRRLGTRARATAEDTYDWSHIGRKLLSEYHVVEELGYSEKHA